MEVKDRTKMVEENLGLVHACARRFVGKGVDYEDIVSCGCIGLIKAIDNFDESRGLKLSTYAVPAILGEIKRIWRDGGSVKVSRSIKELALKAQRLNEAHLTATGKDLTVRELSAKLQVDENTMAEALSSAQLPLSLSVSDNDSDKGTELAIPISSCEEELAEKLSLKKAIEELEEIDRKLITIRYFGSATQSRTAEILSMTQVQVSRREKKILALLRQKLSE